MRLTIKTILVPTDFSEPAGGALDYAVALAAQFNAALHLLHVCHVPSLATATMDGVLLSVPDWEVPLRAAAQAEMAKLTARTAGLAVSTDVVVGNPPTAIVAAAAEHGADLIVMGTHGRGPLKHVVLGNVAERVVRTSRCPVLTVRHAEAEAETAAEALVHAPVIV